MSNTEDYLDGLLNSMEGKQNKVETSEVQISDSVEEPLPKAEVKSEEDEFLDSFERELLSGEDADEFIRQFERELDEDAGNVPGDDEYVDTLLNSADDSVRETSEPESLFEEAQTEDDDLDFMVDTLEDIPGDDIDISKEMDDFGDFGDFDQLADSATDTSEASIMDNVQTDDATENDQNLMDLLQSEGDFSDLGDMFDTEEKSSDSMENSTGDLDGFTLEEIPIDDSMILEDESEEIHDEHEGKHKKETSGFLKKLSQVLFGEEEEEGEPVEEPVQQVEPSPSADIEDISDENLMILQELEGTGAEEPVEDEEVPETAEEAKARKKREKAEKKAKKKAEKAEKKAQAKAAREEKKAKKEKKPKKPKEPDNTPPLPKKPVILCFVMAGSFLLLVLLGTNLFGYSSSMENAQKEYGLGNYTEAYQMVSGMKIKEEDDAIYQKYRLMGTVSGEYNAYQTFMESGIYDMALDSLVRTVGRCQKYQPDAELYECAGELARVRELAVGALGGFGITEERALELYAIEEREDYSAQLNAILLQAGYTID